MRCVFCQNHDIAAGEAGREISVERLKEIFLELQEKGANNINLVTPTHFVPLIVPALRAAKREGLRIPIVYNTSSYEKVSTLQLLDGLVDIYLPDLKYESAALSGLLSNAPDYFETATAAIAEMVRQVGEPVFAAPDGTLLLAAQMNDACEEADEDAEFLMKKRRYRAASRPAGTGGRFEESAFLSVKNLWGADLYQSDESVYADFVCAGEDAAKAYAKRLPYGLAAPSDGGRIRSSD